MSPATAKADDEERAALATFAAAASDDLALLADLHDREPTAAIIEALRDCPLDRGLALVLRSKEAQAALEAMRAATDALPVPVDATALDELAMGYTDVYLRYAFRASPAESVWLTEDGLERQAPMFALRELYRRHGLKSTDWAGRPEDHLVVQLRFAAHLLARVEDAARLGEVARFLDAHLLLWIRRFAAQLVNAGAPDWYAALALVTATYLDDLREHLAAMTGFDRPPAPMAPKSSARRPKDAEDRPYIPGVAPSW